MLWEKVFELYLGVKSGSKSTAEVGDGARYRLTFLGLWEYVDIENDIAAGAKVYRLKTFFILP